MIITLSLEAGHHVVAKGHAFSIGEFKKDREMMQEPFRIKFAVVESIHVQQPPVIRTQTTKLLLHQRGNREWVLKAIIKELISYQTEFYLRQSMLTDIVFFTRYMF